ncbi:required for meiotic nuclear division protein 1 homolog [Eurosta solidaginis]|uniref:required for meiotic nuclear division protein 1 homolog n=1 Tax=Eurosta solidaginis TaxID=178769 RepID=UPI00353114D7
MNFVRFIFTKSTGCTALTRKVTTIFYRQISYDKLQHAIQKPLTQFDSKLKQFELKLPTPITHSRKATQSLAGASVAQVLKKRTIRKKWDGHVFEDLCAEGFFNVSAFTTAEEYDLEALMKGLEEQNLYTVKKYFSTDNLGVEQNVLYATAKYPVGEEERDIIFFREGSVVLWNFNEIETNNLLSFVRQYEKDPYLSPLVRGESEVMPYMYIPSSAVDVEGDMVSTADTEVARAFFYNGKFFLASEGDNFLQKYTFSNAMATSIKLGMWEAMLERYIDSMEYLTDDLKRGRRIRMSRAEVLRKTGELFALRHEINLASDLLDTPDFYWDREELEALYLQVCSYFSITRRTKVMNEKINHCVELAELISHNLNDAHHIRLEWMIIILIMVEVGFEIMHYMDRLYNKENESLH